jgi:hypothetical protein
MPGFRQNFVENLQKYNTLHGFIVRSFNDPVTITVVIRREDDQEKNEANLWKEVVVAYFKVLSRYENETNQNV